MATSALVCINLKTRGKREGEGEGPNTQELVQALVDNGIIQLNSKATIRVVEGKEHQPPELHDFKTLSLGTFAVRQAPDQRSGILLETVGEGGEEQKVVVGSRAAAAILVQRNLVVGGSGVAVVSKAVQLLPEPPPPPPPPPPLAVPLNFTLRFLKDGEPIKLPENLESLPKAEHFPTQRHRWNTNEEIAAILICFERHMDWQSKEVKIRPKSGSMLLYSRKKVRYRRDGYCWKKRKDGKTTREDHMKLKVQGTECIYGCYVHSAILPTFHRRCYWLLQNPDIVLVHYLNVPYPDDNKLVSPSLALCADKKQWTKEELVSQLKPMFYSEEEPELNNELEISTAETVETIVSQLLERQRSARASAMCKQLECGCPDSTCTDAKTCSQPIRRISSAPKAEPSPPDSNQVSAKVSSTTGSGLLVQRSMHHQERQVHSTNQHSLSQSGSGSGGSSSGPLVLNLSQIQGSGGLLILNSNQHGGPVAVKPTPMQLTLPQSQPQQTRMDSSNGNTSCQVSQRMVTQDRRSASINQQNNNNQQSGGVNNGNPPRGSSGGEDKLDNRLYNTGGGSGKKQQDAGNEKQTSFLNSATGKAEGAYYETLDLSQEDIQQTLSANMPISCTTSETNRLCFRRGLFSREPGGEGSKEDLPSLEIDFIDVNASQQVDDDVFVNLDAFDMLSEFPELEGLDHNHNGGSGELNQSVEREKESSSPQRMDYREGTANITDFSPEWAYTEGGVKVLVTGPWYSTTSPYTVLFDSVPVPTTLVQSGVLRCYCPAHEAGLATLQVACEGFVISNSAMFEYKRGSRERSEVKVSSGGQAADSLLRYTLMQRLDALDHNLDIKQEPHDLVEGNSLLGHGNLEEKLVGFVHRMQRSEWRRSETNSAEWFESYRSMTLLHLAASQGFSRLVCALVHWRNENPSPLLDIEVDGLSQDADGYTPLMWACKRGHRQTALLLYEWQPAAISLLGKSQESALDLAKSSGHSTLASDLTSRLHQPTKDFLLTQSNIGLGSNEELTHASLESLHSSRDDGIFLKPLNITRNESQNSLELHVNIPSTAEGQMCSRLSSPSPSSVEGHNGKGLVKRPSVDSGIQLQSSLDSLPSLRSVRHGKQGGRDTPKLSRFDRSMSLPLTTPMSCLDTPSYDSSIESLRHSPARRMDFALCEVHPGGNSPDSVMLLSATQEEEPATSVGEQEVRVLTLAEQIIAAMPERIKNESETEMMVLGSEDMETMDSIDPLLLDEPPSSSSSFCFDTTSEFNFDHTYRYYEVDTPCSSLSPASCLPSPSFPLPHSPSPPPTTADFCEFLHASNSTYFEKDFSNLTLSDREQRELYEAAKVIQKAYRSYKGRKKLEQDKERQAAVLIQNYYRRYKQYAYFKQMTKAAMVIQNGYRSYCENKRFKKNQEAAIRVQNSYRTDTPTTGLKRTYSQRRQHQAARKIQQFMRQSKNKLQRERAERERQVPCKGSPQN